VLPWRELDGHVDKNQSLDVIVEYGRSDDCDAAAHAVPDDRRATAGRSLDHGSDL
jgi:hypothetical protein